MRFLLGASVALAGVQGAHAAPPELPAMSVGGAGAAAGQVTPTPPATPSIADQPGTASDMIPIISECLKDKDFSKAAVAADGWSVKLYSLGSARSSEALRSGDRQGMLDAMTQRSTVFIKEGQRGYLNLRSSRTVFVSCQAYVNIASADQSDVIKSDIIKQFGLTHTADIKVNFDIGFFLHQNILEKVEEYYRVGNSYVVFALDKQQEKNVFSAYVFQG
jgi:hypothetical protein